MVHPTYSNIIFIRCENITLAITIYKYPELLSLFKKNEYETKTKINLSRYTMTYTYFNETA